MLRIVHIDTGAEIRGGQQQLLMLARGLRDRGHEQLMVTPEGTALEARASREGFRVWVLPAYDVAHAHGIFQFRQLLSATRFEILHAHDGRGQTLSWLASMGMDVRRVASRRVAFLPARKMDSRFKYGHTCDAVIAVSKFVRELLVGSGVPAARIEVIHDGVELPAAVVPDTTSARGRTGARKNTQGFLVGMIGSHAHEKGQDVALRAATLLHKSMPEVQLVVAMPGNTPSLVTDCPNVTTSAHPENLGEFFGGLELFIMPSLTEGLGSAALLAMAHGLPVVASHVGGLPEIVEDGVTGWLIPPGDAAVLAGAIARAASDRPRLHEIGVVCRERAQQFSSTIMVDRTEKLYNKLCHGVSYRAGE